MLVGGVLKVYAKGGLDEFDHTGGDKDGVKNRDQKPFFFFPHYITGRYCSSMYFSVLAPVGFREIGKDNKEHHRVFDPVDIGPEDSQKREEPDLLPLEFQNVEKNDDEKVGKEVRPHHRFPVEDHDGA